jgi:hypothetical protein
MPIQTYSNFHSFSADKLHASHQVLLHLNKLGKLLAEIGAEGASSLLAECVT